MAPGLLIIINEYCRYRYPLVPSRFVHLCHRQGFLPPAFSHCYPLPVNQGLPCFFHRGNFYAWPRRKALCSSWGNAPCGRGNCYGTVTQTRSMVVEENPWLDTPFHSRGYLRPLRRGTHETGGDQAHGPPQAQSMVHHAFMRLRVRSKPSRAFLFQNRANSRIGGASLATG